MYELVIFNNTQTDGQKDTQIDIPVYSPKTLIFWMYNHDKLYLEVRSR